MHLTFPSAPQIRESKVPQIASIFLKKYGGVYVSLRTAESSTYAHHWQNVGGKIDFAVDDTIVDGAVRETLEETGLRIAPHRFAFLARMECTSEMGSPYEVSCFSVDLHPHEIPKRLESKNTPWMLVMPDEIPHLTPSVPSLLATAMQLKR